MSKVIVLGGGIGGVEAAFALRKKNLEVELVSDRDYLFVYPLAICIPTGERSFDRVRISLRDILCVMDMGNGAGFVYRNKKRALIIPLPVVGHWLKRSWGRYYELVKLGKIPRIPGM